MTEYTVKISSYAYRNIEEIYQYISQQLLAPDAAKNLALDLENAILSLDQFPYRGALRKHGRYAGKGYRQLLVKNFTIIYRIVEEKQQVIILTVHYSPRNL